MAIVQRQSHLSRQVRQLYAVDEEGRRLLDEDGNQYFDLDRAPLVLQDLGVPRKLSTATFAGSKFKHIDEVRQWFAWLSGDDDTEYCAVLIGDGSNYTAAALLHNAVRQGLTIAWYDWHTFAARYTARISIDRRLARGSSEEASAAAWELSDLETTEDDLRGVFEVLAIIDFDINDVRDFAVPEICAMVRNRSRLDLTTVIAVPTASSEPMDVNPTQFGVRGSLLRLFEHEAKVFDGR